MFAIYLLTIRGYIAIFILSLSLETHKITEFTTDACNKFNFFHSNYNREFMYLVFEAIIEEAI